MLDAARLKPNSFTRKRSLSFPTVLAFLLSGLQGAVQSELDQFFANLKNRADSVREVTAQAFCQALYKISALVFSDINRKLIALTEGTPQHSPLARLARRRWRWQHRPPDGA